MVFRYTEYQHIEKKQFEQGAKALFIFFQEDIKFGTVMNALAAKNLPSTSRSNEESDRHPTDKEESTNSCVRFDINLDESESSSEEIFIKKMDIAFFSEIKFMEPKC